MQEISIEELKKEILDVKSVIQQKDLVQNELFKVQEKLDQVSYKYDRLISQQRKCDKEIDSIKNRLISKILLMLFDIGEDRLVKLGYEKAKILIEVEKTQNILNSLNDELQVIKKRLIYIEETEIKYKELIAEKKNVLLKNNSLIDSELKKLHQQIEEKVQKLEQMRSILSFGQDTLNQLKNFRSLWFEIVKNSHSDTLEYAFIEKIQNESMVKKIQRTNQELNKSLLDYKSQLNTIGQEIDLPVFEVDIEEELFDNPIVNMLIDVLEDRSIDGSISSDEAERYKKKTIRLESNVRNSIRETEAQIQSLEEILNLLNEQEMRLIAEF